MNLEYCDHCGDDFNYDDCGGYRPPCECGLNCRSCCEHGACERDDCEPRDEDESDWQDYELRPGVDYGDTVIGSDEGSAPSSGGDK